MGKIQLRMRSLEIVLSPILTNVMNVWGESGGHVKVPGKVWLPKNPEVRMPCDVETVLSDEQWRVSKFPFFPLPEEVSTHVNVPLWTETIKIMQEDFSARSYVPLMEKVLKDLVEGCDSKVRYPGTTATRSANVFPVPEVDIPRIADALASEVKARHMAGPFDIGHVAGAKVNGFVSIGKPDGSRRQVGNLSHPPGLSFNDNIDPKVLS